MVRLGTFHDKDHIEHFVQLLFRNFQMVGLVHPVRKILERIITTLLFVVVVAVTVAVAAVGILRKTVLKILYNNWVYYDLYRMSSSY